MVTELPWVSPAGGAYLCFTSGSTGKPKGVLCTHQGIVAFQRDLEVRLFAAPGSKIAQTMSVSFDGSIHEIFSALSYGATLILPNDDDPFGHLLEANAAILTPSVAKVLDPADYPKLNAVSSSLYDIEYSLTGARSI
jgi:non-ribosomal peptide synthetase component F